ncbi:hypothetical protein [Bdellovibrio sp. HCB209]|uniref:hypothetical protein n=1 Tax=Bdellovibrio sp. HCB209 TaxID=3394354 RepID=UPI0039B3ECD4
MVKYAFAGVAAFYLVGCASGGGGNGGRGGLIAGTMYSSPATFSQEEFNKDQKKYSKTWTTYKGGGVDSYKKVVIPTYSLNLQTDMYTVAKNKLASLVNAGDGARSTLTFSVNFPWEKNQQVMQEIAGISYNRLKEKFKKTGVEVVEWSSVVAASDKASKYEKENFGTTPVVKGESFVSFSAPNVPRVVNTSIYAISSLSRDAEVSLFFPNFTVGFGYFGGETTPFTIAEGHGMSGTTFTPQVQVLSGSGFGYQSKWNAGGIALDKTAISNVPFVLKLDKEADSRTRAGEKEELMRNTVVGLSGAKSHEVKVSSAASIVYNLDVDSAKFKDAVLKELDAAEDLIVSRYKMEL